MKFDFPKVIAATTGYVAKLGLVSDAAKVMLAIDIFLMLALIALFSLFLLHEIVMNLFALWRGESFHNASWDGFVICVIGFVISTVVVGLVDIAERRRQS